jgi:recombinational DNA repair protein (RecF pathway)
MKLNRRVHYFGNGCALTACGFRVAQTPSIQFSRQQEKVTCKKCLKELRR